MMKRLLSALLAAILAASPAVAFPHGGGPSPAAIGGLAVGARGPAGTIYQGYTLAAADNFGSALNIVTGSAPNAPYFPVRNYSDGARTTSAGYLSGQYDTDPAFTGAQDSNRGLAVGSNNMAQANNVLTLAARLAGAGETPYISGRTYAASMIHTGGYVTASPPVILEAYIKYPSGTAPSGEHSTFWVTSSQYLKGTNVLEADFECNTYGGTAPTAISDNYNVFGTVPGWTAGAVTGSQQSLFDGQYHLQSFILTASSLKHAVDGTVTNTVANDTTALGFPYRLLFTNHVLTPATPADWTGVTWPMSVAYYRIWVPTAGFPQNVYSPTQSLPTAQFAYNTSISYTLPAAATLWGAGVSDICQAIKLEDYETGSTNEGGVAYTQFPTGYTLTGRTLTGISTDQQPGRVHVACTPNVPGGTVGYVARGYFDIGPVVTSGNLTATHGVSYDYDVYPAANVGTLLPKTLTVTGLPAGLTFSPSTGHITGTPTSAGSSTLAVGRHEFRRPDREQERDPDGQLMDSPYAPNRPAHPPEVPASRPVPTKATAAQRELDRLKAIVARWKID